MRSLIVSLSILLFTVGAITVNSVLVARKLDMLSELIESGESSSVEEKYREMERFLALSVSDSQLAHIEERIVEYEEAAQGEDEAELELQKSRLLSAIAQTKRLSGVNIRSVA